MTDEATPADSGYLTTSALAARADFTLGSVRVSPSRRIVSGPDGSRDVEPRVMQVLVVLAEHPGAVVTRHMLFDRCWGTTNVGDDSLNRAVAAIRRLAAEVGQDSFEVETIPRTGYRLTIAGDLDRSSASEADANSAAAGLSRRQIVAGAAGLLVAGAAGAGYWWKRDEDRRFTELMQRGRGLLDYGEAKTDPIGPFRDAVDIRPDDPDAQGLLALAMALVDSGEKDLPSVADVHAAVQKSLSLDASNTFARTAAIRLEWVTMDMATMEDRLRSVIASSSDNIYAMRMLWWLLQTAGRSREALATVEQAMAIAPFAAANNYPRGQLLWIVGRAPESDRILERAIEAWPDHRFVRFARFTILAFTGRPEAAATMLDNPSTRPQAFSPEAVSLWRRSLAALIDPSPRNRNALIDASREAVERDPRLVRHVVLPLSAVGEVDAAFEVADAQLALRPVAPGGKGSSDNSLAWRFAPWAFTPPAAAMRADPRFATLCDSAGLTAYWEKRGVKPDYLVHRA